MGGCVTKFRHLLVALLLTGVVAGGLEAVSIVGAEPAAASSTYHVSGTGIGIRIRNSPHWNDATSTALSDGTAVTVVCEVMDGDAVGQYGNRIWESIQWNGVSGWLPDTFMD